MSTPPFGTASAYTDSFPSPPPKELTVSPETCYNLNVFRNIIRQYRKFDDQIVTRLNRAQAQLRDEARVGKGSSSEGMCAKIWTETMAGWSHRQTLITYCSTSVEASVAAKKAAEEASRQVSEAGWSSRSVGEEQVVADQLASEATVEAIVRKRTLEVFKNRCPFFTPSPGASRQWWDLADSGRAGAGPEVPTVA